MLPAHHHCRRFRHHPHLCRCGVAPLEFVMVLPIFVILFAAAVYAIVAFMTMIDLDVQCRNNTWKKRNETARTKPFDFSASANPPTVLEESASIHSGIPMFDQWGLSAQSKHLLYVGTWDWREVKAFENTDFHRKEPVRRLYGNALKGLVAKFLSDLERALNEFLSGFEQGKKDTGIDQKDIERMQKESEKAADDAIEVGRKEIQKSIDQAESEIPKHERNIENLKNSLSGKLAQTPGLESTTLESLINSRDFNGVDYPDVFKNIVDKVNGMSEEDRKKPENAKDVFIVDNIGEFQKLREEQLDLDAQKEIRDSGKDMLSNFP